ncbi:MAG: alpha/beta hydrolase [Methanotrichaceae archaeon]|nr:alpha/beta hydrolase [Methanotrichaceae archaeon]
MSTDPHYSRSISFLNDPLILQHIFHPRRIIDPGNLPNRMVFSFPVTEMVKIDGILHVAGANAPNLLFFHGNGENAYDYDDIGSIYTSLGINLLVADYRGYGTSSGQPTYSNMISDAIRIFLKFSDFCEIKGWKSRIFIKGRSLGSAPAIALASKYPDAIAGLIVESGFAYTYNLLVKLGVDPSLLDTSKEKMVSNLEKMKKVELPVLVIHGEFDELIPFSDGIALYKAALTEHKYLVMIPRAGHNTLFLCDMELYFNSVANFIKLSS